MDHCLASLTPGDDSEVDVLLSATYASIFLLLYCFQQRLFKDTGKVLRSEICRFWLSWPLNDQSNSKIVI